MTISPNLHHRRAVAAMHRRAPVPDPQLGFDPSQFSDFTDFFGTGAAGKHKTKGVTADNQQGDPTSSDSPTLSTTVVSTSTASTSSSTPVSTSTPPIAVTQQQLTTLLPKSTTTIPPSVTSTSTLVVPSTTASFPASTVLASASSSPSADPSTGISTGSVVGGIAAGIVAIAAIGFAAVYFVRRSRKTQDDVSFDAHDFRRSAMVLSDPPTHQDTVERGFNPGPPSPPHMMENRMASPAPTYNTHAAPGPNYYGNEYSDNRAGYGAGQFQSYNPGQVFNAHGGAPSPNPIHPMAPPANYGNYGQSPFSPVASPDRYNQYEAQPKDGNMYGQAAAAAAAAGSGAAYPVLTRQTSGSSSHSPKQQQMADLQRESTPAGDYIDLDRSSVSPYQAAQYAEISRRLKTGLNTTDVDRDLPPLPLTPGDKPDPFADPASAPPSPGGQYATDRRHIPSTSSRPLSGDSIEAHALEFPVPPSPAHTVSSRYHIDPTPPTLPEIHVESRVSYSGYELPRNSTASSSPLGGVTGLNIGPGKRFPTTPSPLASNVAATTPEPEPTTFERATPAVEPPAPAVAHDTTSKEQKRSTTHSMYDAEDAYGGI